MIVKKEGKIMLNGRLKALKKLSDADIIARTKELGCDVEQIARDLKTLKKVRD